MPAIKLIQVLSHTQSRSIILSSLSLSHSLPPSLLLIVLLVIGSSSIGSPGDLRKKWQVLVPIKKAEQTNKHSGNAKGGKNSGKSQVKLATAKLTRIFLRISEFFMLQRLFTAGIGSNTQVYTERKV